MPDANKTRETRLRRMAERQGLKLVKSKRRDPRALDYQGWWMVDVQTGRQLLGGQFGASIDEVERHLTGEAT